MRSVAAVLAFAALVVGPTAASAVTPDQIVAMSKAGVSDAVIVAVIDRDQTIFELAPDQLVALKSQGLSDTVLLAMLKSGRAAGDAAARADEDANAARILAALPTAPEVLIVGHGPDLPNTSYLDRLYWNPTYVIPFIPPYAYAYASPYRALRNGRRAGAAPRAERVARPAR